MYIKTAKNPCTTAELLVKVSAEVTERFIVVITWLRETVTMKSLQNDLYKSNCLKSINMVLKYTLWSIRPYFRTAPVILMARTSELVKKSKESSTQ